MAQQNINVGAVANDHLGDPIRTAFQKAQSNFTELYSTAVVVPASESAAGIVELATTGEATTGTDAARAVTPAGLAAHVATYVAVQDIEVFKGAIDCSANPNYPAADAGHVYRVSVEGKIGGASGPDVEVSDRLECLVDSTAAGTHAAVGANWMISQVNIDGAVIGPASVADDLPAIFDGATGKLIKSKTYAAFKTLLLLVKGDVGLGSVDNTADTAKPVSTAQQTALDLKANLSSPTLTGTPAAPTAADATNTTQIATTAFVQSAITLLRNGVAGAFDTLAEIATELGLKATLASPAFTGTPTAPTPATTDSDTSVATTAFAQALKIATGSADGLDLDTVTTPGDWSGNTNTNGPIAGAFFLTVHGNAGADANYVYQEFAPLATLTAAKYIRMRSAGTWGAWKQFTLV